MPLQTFISHNIWSKLGAEHDAFMLTDNTFSAVATGGFNSSLRDFARFGVMILNNGKWNGHQIISESWIKNITYLSKENRQRVARSVYKDSNSKAYDANLNGYHDFWWVHDSSKGIFTARGVFGQTLYINKEKKVVIATFASAPTASNSTRETYKLKLAAMQYLADHL